MLSYWFKSVGVGFQEHVSDRSGRDNEFGHVITRGRFNFARSRSKHVRISIIFPTNDIIFLRNLPVTKCLNRTV